MRRYKGHIIYNAARNSSGIKYYYHNHFGDILRADTLAGIKQLINEEYLK